MGKKKPFIDRKKSITFRLVPRSQKDPLIVDEDVGQNVLHPVSSKDLEQRAKYGIYYTDNYNYLQHLKTVGETIEIGEVDRTILQAPNPNLNLPSVIFETKGVELKVGLLNQIVPRNELLPDVDPDIAAALDGDFEAGSAEGLDDDFVLQLNAENYASSTIEKNPLKDEKSGKSELMKRFGLTREEKFSDESSDDDGTNNDDGQDMGVNGVASDREERQSRFTNYSMSSAVIKRPDGLQIIDEHFESLYAEYDDDKCGYIDNEAETIGGHMKSNDDRFQKLVDDYALSTKKFVPEKPTKDVKERVLKYAENNEEEETESDSESDEDDLQTRKRRWDSESILSTYSNTKNHPLLIRENGGAKRSRRQMETNAILEQMDDSQSICTSASSVVRPRGETAEERRARKAAVREERRMRRAEKKMNKEAFKEQKKEFNRQRSAIQIEARPIR